MSRLLSKWKKLILILFLTFFSLFLITLDVKDKRSFFFIDTIDSAVFTPIKAFINSIVQGVDRMGEDYLSLRNVKEENMALRKEIENLKMEKARLLEIEKQHDRLVKLLDLKKVFPPKTVTAEVISNDFSNWFKVIVVNRGEESGVHRRMAVVTADGLVGRTVEVNSHSTKVLLLTDFRSAVDAMVQRTRDRGVVKGNNSSIFEMKYIPLNAEIKIGDAVISSGLGGVFPKGFFIGTITKIKRKKNSLFQEAEVVPNIDLSKIEEVFIITKH